MVRNELMSSMQKLYQCAIKAVKKEGYAGHLRVFKPDKIPSWKIYKFTNACLNNALTNTLPTRLSSSLQEQNASLLTTPHTWFIVIYTCRTSTLLDRWRRHERHISLSMKCNIAHGNWRCTDGSFNPISFYLWSTVRRLCRLIKRNFVTMMNLQGRYFLIKTLTHKFFILGITKLLNNKNLWRIEPLAGSFGG